MTTKDLINCAKRELYFRNKVYPRKVRKETMAPGTMEREIAAMEKIIEVLEALHNGDFKKLEEIRREAPQQSMF